ncbi:MAG TPA: hypothetical protein VMH80_09155 [Bryobacteraceae bacterium]|nr:hypothetical protein [Bryobacteraceae bacterium]
MDTESAQAAELIAPSTAQAGEQLALTLAGTVAVALEDCFCAFGDTWPELLHATRSWLQYGTVGFAVLCIVVGAVEGLFGR